MHFLVIGGARNAIQAGARYKVDPSRDFLQRPLDNENALSGSLSRLELLLQWRCPVEGCRPL